MTDPSKEFVAAFDIENMSTEEPSEVDAEAVEPAESDDLDTTLDEIFGGPDEAEEDEEEEEEPYLWAGKYKSPEDMEKGLRDLQAHKDREIAEVRAKLEAFETILSGGPEEQYEQPRAEVSEEQLVNGVQQAPVDTFQWALGNRPDLVPSIIGLVRDMHGHVPADQMQSTFHNAMLMSQQEKMYEQFGSAIQQITGPAQIKQSFETAINHVASQYGEDFEALREQVAVELENIGELESYDPQTVALAIEYAFLRAARNESLTWPVQSPAPSPQEFVETGTPGQGTHEPTGDDKLVSDVAAAMKKMWI